MKKWVTVVLVAIALGVVGSAAAPTVGGHATAGRYINGGHH